MTKAMILVSIAAALSGCGKDNFNGKYTGYEQQVSSATTQSMYTMDQRVEFDLKHEDGIVSGTVTYPDSGQTGQITADAEKSDKLDNVEIRIVNTYGQQYNTGYPTGGYTGATPYYGASNCTGVFRGGLDAPADGKRLTGTLTAVNTSNSTMGYSTCTGKSLTLLKQ